MFAHILNEGSGNQTRQDHTRQQILGNLARLHICSKQQAGNIVDGDPWADRPLQGATVHIIIVGMGGGNVYADIDGPGGCPCCRKQFGGTDYCMTGLPSRFVHMKLQTKA